MASFTEDKNQIRNEFRILSNLYNDFSNLESIINGHEWRLPDSD